MKFRGLLVFIFIFTVISTALLVVVLIGGVAGGWFDKDGFPPKGPVGKDGMQIELVGGRDGGKVWGTPVGGGAVCGARKEI